MENKTFAMVFVFLFAPFTLQQLCDIFLKTSCCVPFTT